MHLTVHVVGLTVASGLVVYAVVRREEASAAWHSLAVGGALLALSHLATGALWANELAWPVYARAAGYAALAVGAAGRLTGMAVVVAVAPPAAHLAAATAGAMAAFAATRGALGRGRAVLPLAAGLVLWAAADLVTPSHAAAAAGLSVAGSLAAGAWLLRRAGGSLLARFVVASVAILLLLVLGLASASGVLLRSDLERERLQGLGDLAAGRAVEVGRDWPAELRRTAAPLAGSQLAEEFTAGATGDRADLDRRAATLAELFGVDEVLLVASGGSVVGSWADDRPSPGPLAPADELELAGTDVVRSALAGNASGAVVAVGAHRLVAVGAVPVVPRDQAGEPLRDRSPGAVVLLRAVTDTRYVEEVAAQTGLDATIVVDGTTVASTLPEGPAAAVPDAIDADGTTRVARLGEQNRLLAAAPLRDERGATVGQVVLTADGAVLADLEETTTRSLFLLALVGMAAASGLAAVAANRTTGPIRRLTEAAERIAEGDLSVRLEPGGRDELGRPEVGGRDDVVPRGAAGRDTVLPRGAGGRDTVLPRGAGGRDEVGRLAAAFDDMTVALTEREEALREAAATEAALRERLEVVTGSMSEALVAVDHTGRVTTANAAARALLGDDGVVGRDIGAVLATPDAAGHALLDGLGPPDADGPAAARGTVVVAAAPATDAGPGRQRVVPVAATAAPLRDDHGAPLGRVYVLRDISGEVEVERMKTEFLANVSHELRTPLTPIKGYAEVMRAKDVGFEQTAEFAGSILLSTQRLERIIGMLVDFASLEAGRMRVALEPTSLGDVVDEVLARWRQAHPDRRYVRRLRRGLPEVQADPALLDRVLEELVDNATKFSDGTVSLLADHGPPGTVELTVRDRGRGIEAAALETILRDFHQADGSATRRFGGLGLGLSIVQRIVDRFDAAIEVRSEPDVGTDVVVRLPVVGP